MSLSRPQSHVTGDAGERLFVSGVPHSWLPDKQASDYAIDFSVRVLEAHLVTGIHFGAQVKTTTRHPQALGTARVEVEVAHLTYWLDDHVPPVFLVACDLAGRRLSFVDIDDVARSFPPDGGNRKRSRWASRSPIPSRSTTGFSRRFGTLGRVAWDRRRP